MDSRSTRSLTVPVGASLVHPFPLSLNVTMTPYVMPQFLVRLAASEEDDSDDDEEGQTHGPQMHGFGFLNTSDANTGFGIQKGIVVGVQRLFGGLDVELTSLEGSEPVYRIFLGMRF